MVMVSSKVLSLETRRGFTITSQRQTCKHGVETTRVLSIGKKSKMVKSAGKVMARVLWDRKAVLLVDFMEKGTKINAASYCASLELLRAAIKRQRLGLLTTGVLLLHDNALPHVATATQQLLHCVRWTILEYSPYSPDLVQNDSQLFPTLRIFFLATSLQVTTK